MFKKLKNLKPNIGWKSLILIGVCVVLVLVDLITKICEEKYCWNFTVIPHLIVVKYGSRNPGCAFSFLRDASWGQPFLIAMTFILLIGLFALFIFMPEKLLILKISIAVICAGAIGNLIDRIAFREVRDFVELNMFGWVSCNFADFWIVIGSVLAVIDLMFLNEYSVIPLTKHARAVQAERKENEKAEQNEEVKIEEIPDSAEDIKQQTDEDKNGE